MNWRALFEDQACIREVEPLRNSKKSEAKVKLMVNSFSKFVSLSYLCQPALSRALNSFEQIIELEKQWALLVY